MRTFPKIRKVMLIQPNYGWFGRRAWKIAPYGLGILNAILKADFDSWIYDPSLKDIPEAEVRKELRNTSPDVVGISTYSTDYFGEWQHLAKLIKEELPDAVVVLGGMAPTLVLDKAMEDPHVDFFVMGEGEKRFPALLKALDKGVSALAKIDGIAYNDGKNPVVQPAGGFLEDLDSNPFPDFSNMDVMDYGNYLEKYAHYIAPRQFPYAWSITSRGCPYQCIFCAAKIVSGRKVRMRSAENILKEIDHYHDRYKIKEMIFLDDHFFASMERAEKVMRGLIERKYDLTWKIGNITLWKLDEKIVKLLKESGCYQVTISPESGCQEVLDGIIKKPVKLDKLPPLLALLRRYDLEVAANFVIGFPGETWDQIRRTADFAAGIDVDYVNFHLATPYPRTELMELCIKRGLIKTEDDTLFGHSRGVVSTDEFEPGELQILRAFEWDRINFRSEERKKRIALMEGISMEELEAWRRSTRRSLGVTSDWREAGKKT